MNRIWVAVLLLVAVIVWQHACFVFERDELSPAYAMEVVAGKCHAFAKAVGIWFGETFYAVYDAVKTFLRALKLYELWRSIVRLACACWDLVMSWTSYFVGFYEVVVKHVTENQVKIASMSGFSIIAMLSMCFALNALQNPLVARTRRGKAKVSTPEE